MIRFTDRAAAALLFLLTLATLRVSAEPSPPLAPSKPDDANAPRRTLDEAERKTARFHMDFDKVDITEVIKYIAQWTGRNFILADNIHGKITIIGPTDVTADEAYRAFLAALKTNNLQVTPTGKFLKIEAMKDVTKTPIPTCLGPDCQNVPGFPTGDASNPFNEQMVTRLFRTRYTEAESLKTVLNQFTSRDGELDVFPPDVLILSDTSLNVARVESILKALDQPGSRDELNVVTLLHATATELAATLNQIFQQQGAPAAGASGPRHLDGSVGSHAGGQAAAEGPVSVTKIIPDERTNRLIIVAGANAFDRVRDLIGRLDIATDTGQVHVYYLENADAEELASTLSQLTSGSGGQTKSRPTTSAGAPPAPTPPAPSLAAAGDKGAMFTGQVKVTADKSTNSLLVSASPNDYRNMLKIIDRLDIRRRQVFIEAVVMEVKLNDSNTFSVDWHSGAALSGVNVPGSTSSVAPLLLGNETSGAGASLSLANLASMTGFVAGIQGPPINISGTSISLPSFGVVVNALQSNSDVNTISTPSMLISDNSEAEISVGQTVPFQTAVPLSSGLSALTSSAGTTSTSSLGSLGSLLGGGYAAVQRVPVELRLKIKAHINSSDKVRLEVDEQVENIASVSESLGPTTAKRAVKTTVTADDQSSVVIGGLIQEQTTHSETRTPVLGDIPVIGALFRSEEVTREKTNLLLFLTPYIIREQGDFRAIYERKLRERQEFVARYFGAEDQYQAEVDYPRKHGPLAVLMKGIRDEFSRVENGGTGSPDETVILADPKEAKVVALPSNSGMVWPESRDVLPPPTLPVHGAAATDQDAAPPAHAP